MAIDTDETLPLVAPDQAGEAAGEAGGLWCLEEYHDGEAAPIRTPIRPLPFRIGRDPELEMHLADAGVSARHCEIFESNGHLAIRDLSSTNGTFVNRQRLRGDRPLQEGDLLHIARRSFHLVRLDAEAPFSATEHIPRIDLQVDPLANRQALERLIREPAIESYFQPIYDLAARHPVAWEALTYGAAEDLPRPPSRLFAMAEATNLAVELSRVCRQSAIEAFRAAGSPPGKLFLNMHPEEMNDPAELHESLKQALGPQGRERLVLELHETAIVDLEPMRRLRRELEEQRIELAYDDFGAGQARLLQLVEVPPSYLKFDLTLIRGIDLDRGPKRRLVSSLLETARDLGITSVAEGIETVGEAAACTELGFELGQGHFFGLPGPLPARSLAHRSG